MTYILPMENISCKPATPLAAGGWVTGQPWEQRHTFRAADSPLQTALAPQSTGFSQEAAHQLD